jgi:hypothetical protein
VNNELEIRECGMKSSLPDLRCNSDPGIFLSETGENKETTVRISGFLVEI